MYFKTRTINGKQYRYAVNSVRLPDGTLKKIEVACGKKSKEEIERISEEKAKREYAQAMMRKYGADHIFTKEELEKIEIIRFDYKKIMKKLSRISLNDLFNRFTANFTYESNALEGNSLTLKNVVVVMFENISVSGKDLREIYETKNSREVVEMIFKKRFTISADSIIKMHEILMRDTDVRLGYKAIPNVILGRDIETTLPENVEGEMNNLIKWYHENKDRIHPLKIAAIFHGMFERIHPFEDGNGRVGRFLINVILVENKYPPLIIRKSQRIAYLNTLEKFDKGHKDTLERFILERFKETYKKFFEIYVRYV